MNKVVIVGAGQAGAVAALTLREMGFEGAITLLGQEPHPPHERPELSKGYVLGKTDFARLVVLTPEVAAEKGIDLRLDATVTAVDRAGGRVGTAGGSLPYDALILATGGVARSLPLPPALAARSHSVRTREDADGLAAALARGGTVAVIGGGWLGTELALTARAAGAEVELIEAAPRLCARVAPEWLSAHLARLQQEAGVRLHLGRMPEVTEGGEIVLGADRIRPALVIQAIGMRAGDDLARAAGLDCDEGVLVDDDGRSADPAIFAIGDCARHRAPGSARRESWQNANQSAEDAVRALLGAPARPREPDWFWSHQNGVNVQMLGRCSEGAHQIERRAAKGGVSCLFVENSRLVGCVALDCPRDIAGARKAIQSGQAVDTDLVADPRVAIQNCLIDRREAVSP